MHINIYYLFITHTASITRYKKTNPYLAPRELRSWGAAPNEPWVQTFGRIRNCFLLQSATSQLTLSPQISRYIIYYLSTPISRTSGRAPAGWVLWTVLWGRQWLVKVSDGTFGLPASSQFNVCHLQQGGNLCCPFNILNTKQVLQSIKNTCI